MTTAFFWKRAAAVSRTEFQPPLLYWGAGTNLRETDVSQHKQIELKLSAWKDAAAGRCENMFCLWCGWNDQTHLSIASNRPVRAGTIAWPPVLLLAAFSSTAHTSFTLAFLGCEQHTSCDIPASPSNARVRVSFVCKSSKPRSMSTDKTQIKHTSTGRLEVLANS